MHKEKSNTVRGRRGWKVGVVHDVHMLGRSGINKPEVPRLLIGSA